MSAEPAELPRNAVDTPILNSPFREPTRYWDFRGPRPVIREGRRAAGYFGVARTERMGGGAQAAQQLIPLPLVNEIRARVKAWREAGYPNVTRITRDLLDHWAREDRRPLFFCQREAVETMIWLVEASPADRQGLDVPRDVPSESDRVEHGYAALERYCAKMATGSGKTIVMAMVAAWSILNKVADRRDARFSDAVLIVGPNLTVKERLSVLLPHREDNYYTAFDLVPRSYLDLLARGRVLVTNWHVFAPKEDKKRGVVQRGRESDEAFARRVLGKELGRAEKILVLNDEAHHAWRPAPRAIDEEAALDETVDLEEELEEAKVWVAGLDRIHARRGILRVVDVSATPFYIHGSGHVEGEPFPWLVSDFGLVDAIESGITKIPRVPVADDSGRPDPKYFHLWRRIDEQLPTADRGTARRKAKPEAVWKLASGALATLASKWEATAAQYAASKQPVEPALIVVAQNTDLAKVVAEAVQSGEILEAFRGDRTFQIDSKVLAAAEAAEDGKKDKERERLRLKVGTVGRAEWPGGRPPEGFEELDAPPGKHVRCVVSVGMLTEGWDAPNVTQILGLRAFSSQLLCEQVVGRGLRRMSYAFDENGMLQPEYCDVFGIPFEAVPLQSTAAEDGVEPPPSTLVMALPERKHLAIEFPRVEGYSVQVKTRVRCDVDALPELVVEPQVEPTKTWVRSNVGSYGKRGSDVGDDGEVLDRDEYYDEHRIQRTTFEIAREIVEALRGAATRAGGGEQTTRIEGARLLFPQVLAIVIAYVERRVRLPYGAQIEEIALARYRDAIVQRILDGIEPETEDGESALRPRLERFRPIGSTAEVQFRTTKPVVPTLKSHVSHVTLDSKTYEGTAAWHLEQSPLVIAYVKNDRLDFEIPYQWSERPHRYVPDYLVRLQLAGGESAMLILEIKGYEDEVDRTKYAAAQKWARAVSNDGRFGRWAFVVCREPNELGRMLLEWRDELQGIAGASQGHRIRALLEAGDVREARRLARGTQWERVLAAPTIETRPASGAGDFVLNMRWVEAHRATHVGRWVALSDGDLVAAKATLQELEQAIAERPDRGRLTVLRVDE